MKSTEHWLVHEHTQFESLIRECRTAAEIGDWWAVEHFLKELVESLSYHMAKEEEVLFPAYEKKSESTDMSSLEIFNEHSAMVDAFRKLKKLIDSRAVKETYDCVVALELLLIEHNQNEEQTFLPFASKLLFEDRDDLQLKLSNFVVTEDSRDWGITFKEELAAGS